MVDGMDYAISGVLEGVISTWVNFGLVGWLTILTALKCVAKLIFSPRRPSPIRSLWVFPPSPSSFKDVGIVWLSRSLRTG